MAVNTVYLITGANRGIGKGLVGAYLARKNTTVIAAARSVASADSLYALPKGQGSRLVVVPLDSSDSQAPAKAVKLLSKQGIDHIDVVIANAGIAEDVTPIAKVSEDVVRKHFEVNAWGPLFLFQAVLPLLDAAKNPKFVGVGSPLGAAGALENYPGTFFAYGVSKAALHFICRKIHFEHENITAFPISPGLVQTDMGNRGAVIFGFEKAPVTIEQSVEFQISTIDGATREKTSGHFPAFNEGLPSEGECPW